MATRNPAFRVAIAGLGLAVGLCLVAAVSLLGTPASQIADARSTGNEAESEPIRVATAGAIDNLLDDRSPVRPVPNHPVEDHADQSPSVAEWPANERIAANASRNERGALSDSPSALAFRQHAHLEHEISALRGEVSELARLQLEAQLAAIRNAETLLSRHETTRDLDALAREVEDLRASVAKPFEPVATVPSEPSVTTSSTSPIRIQASEAAPGKFDVDADHVPLSDLVSELAPVAGWNVISATKSKSRVTCHWRSIDLPTALTQLLKVHHLQARVDGELRMIEELPLPPEKPIDDLEWQSTTTAQESPLVPDMEQPAPHDIEITPARPSRHLSDPVEREARNLDGNSTSLPGNTENDPIESLADKALLNSTETQTDAPLFEAAAPLESEIPSTESAAAPIRDVETGPAGEIAPPETDPASDAVPVQPALEETTSVETTPLAPGPLPAMESARPACLPVTAEASAPIETAAPQPPTPEVAITAKIIQIRHPVLSSRGLYHRGIVVTGTGPCPQCGQNHSPEAVLSGHTANGWHSLADGVATGVSPLAPEWIVQRIQQMGEASLTTTPEVRVPSGRMAEIGLTEQQGYRRYLFKGEQGNEQLGFLEGGLQLALRPTLGAAGELTLELKPTATIQRASTAAAIPSATVNVPPGASVILGGLYFDPTTAQSAGKKTNWLHSVAGHHEGPHEIHEVIVILQARPVTSPSRD